MMSRSQVSAFSHDERQIVTVSWDGTAKVWPVRKGKEIYRLEGT